MTEKRTEDMIHEALEGGGGITQAKGHDQKLIVALMSAKGRLGNLSLMVSLLRARKSGHILQEPSFFRTMTTREE